MIEMMMETATAVRKEWSAVCDSVIRSKPKFIKRTRDKMWFSSLEVMADLLEAYHFTAEKFTEKDGSVTLSLNEIDLVENGKDEKEARLNLANAIMEYSVDFYNNYEDYSRAPNRKGHIPYIFKALIVDDAQKIGDMVVCRSGKS